MDNSRNSLDDGLRILARILVRRLAADSEEARPINTDESDDPRTDDSDATPGDIHADPAS